MAQRSIGYRDCSDIIDYRFALESAERNAALIAQAADRDEFSYEQEKLEQAVNEKRNKLKVDVVIAGSMSASDTTLRCPPIGEILDLYLQKPEVSNWLPNKTCVEVAEEIRSILSSKFNFFVWTVIAVEGLKANELHVNVKYISLVNYWGPEKVNVKASKSLRGRAFSVLKEAHIDIPRVTEHTHGDGTYGCMMKHSSAPGRTETRALRRLQKASCSVSPSS